MLGSQIPMDPLGGLTGNVQPHRGAGADWLVGRLTTPFSIKQATSGTRSWVEI